MKDELAGTTAVTVLIKNGKIYCVSGWFYLFDFFHVYNSYISLQGNVGDSRAVISVNGIAHPLSYDHKPANEEESRRIIAAGGWVEFNRVNGKRNRSTFYQFCVKVVFRQFGTKPSLRRLHIQAKWWQVCWRANSHWCFFYLPLLST